MRILLLGANGFIGRELLAALQARGHRVVPAVRRGTTPPPFAAEPAIEIDLNRDTAAETWIARLAGVDAVVNCAGILQAGRGESIEAIHAKSPAALFAACERAGTRRVVHVSAISADRAAATAYATTKLSAEEDLRSRALEWAILRPSLVVARGADGGTAAFRALAAMPFFIPVPGDGMQKFQPIWVDDIAAVVVLALESDRLVRQTICPVGPEEIALRDLLRDYRRWLGIAEAPLMRAPGWLVRLATFVGDRAGGPLNSTALAQLGHGNTGDLEAFRKATGIEPSRWIDGLARHPAHAQDRWHARLYFVRPLLRVTLAFLWLLSGFAGLAHVGEWAAPLATQSHLPWLACILLLAGACVFDIAIAALVLGRWKPNRLAAVQVLAIAAYTVAATALRPSLWLEALAPLGKNVPIVAAVLALGALEDER